MKHWLRTLVLTLALALSLTATAGANYGTCVSSCGEFEWFTYGQCCAGFELNGQWCVGGHFAPYSGEPALCWW